MTLSKAIFMICGRCGDCEPVETVSTILNKRILGQLRKALLLLIKIAVDDANDDHYQHSSIYSSEKHMYIFIYTYIYVLISIHNNNLI